MNIEKGVIFVRIIDAKNAYSAHLADLQEKKDTLTDLLHKDGAFSGTLPDHDRLEISRELSEIEKEYNAVQKAMDGIAGLHSLIQKSAELRQNSEEAMEGAKELGKVLAIYRRIASGAKVPPYDERKLLEFSKELYFAAKAAAILNPDEDKEYDTLWKRKDRFPTEGPSPEEIADNTSIPASDPKLIGKLCKESAE